MEQEIFHNKNSTLEDTLIPVPRKVTQGKTNPQPRAPLSKVKLVMRIAPHHINTLFHYIYYPVGLGRGGRRTKDGRRSTSSCG